MSHFRCQFGTKRNVHFLANWDILFIHKSHIDLSTLEAQCSLAEIKATYDLNANKAPGPNNFPPHLFPKTLRDHPPRFVQNMP